jgi:hypothetical protein
MFKHGAGAVRAGRYHPAGVILITARTHPGLTGPINRQNA